MQCRSDEIKNSAWRKKDKDNTALLQVLLLFFFAFGAWYFSYTLLRQWWDALLFWSSWWYLTELPWTSWSRLHCRYFHNTSKFKSLLHQSMNLFIEIQGTSWQENMDGCFGCMLDVPPCNSKYKLGVNCAFRFCRWTFYSCLGQLTALQVLNVVGFLWTSDPEIDRSCTQKRQRMAHGM